MLCCSFNNWSKANNEKIKKRFAKHITYHEVSGNRIPVFPWLASTFFFSMSGILLKRFPKHSYLLSMYSNKRSWLLLNGLHAIKEKTDMVVAHNAGSFYPAQKFASKKNIPLGIDLEDYHPGETTEIKKGSFLKSLLIKILPTADYISAASPLILEKSMADVGEIKCSPFVMLNYFPSSQFAEPFQNKSDKLLIAWFSQNISFNRGLEQVIPVIKTNLQTELHLFGNCNDSFKKEWLTGVSNIFIHNPLPQAELHQQLSAFDIGLAIEPGKDLNNELAISNKMLAYFQAGLYILASDTKAQNKFIQEHAEHGTVTTLHPVSFQKILNELVDKKEDLRNSSSARFESAKKNCWEKESDILFTAWKKVLA